MVQELGRHYLVRGAAIFSGTLAGYAAGGSPDSPLVLLFLRLLYALLRRLHHNAHAQSQQEPTGCQAGSAFLI
jgi:hypothetical protein